MTANTSADFLVEIGTEELPPKALKSLMLAFAGNLERLLLEQRLDHGEVRPFASPRRLAVVISHLAIAQQDREIEAKGPPVKVAFDDEGTAKPAALAFAKKCGVEVADLQRVSTEKGEWLAFRSVEQGVEAASLLPDLVELALQGLPIPRRMRWGSSDTEFVRPVHWVLMLHGEQLVDGVIMGHVAGNTTRGHRFMSTGEIAVGSPAGYAATLRDKGFVVADFLERRALVVGQVETAAEAAGGIAIATDELIDEVTALTEWPVSMTGHFDEAFLALPSEAITASLTGHQRYFPIADKHGALLPAFVVVANLESKQPDRVRDGNERVIQPRLADAAFFWETDRKHRLDERLEALERVVYQRGLGSLREKSERTAKLCELLERELGLSDSVAGHAARIAKCDLLTGMVGEFPELQGTMGRYYATADGESDAVATAIGEQYLPRFAGDAVPASAAGQVLALADKLDTLAGVFAIGKKPAGNKDPFGLRRAALGVVRILVECRLEIDLAGAVRDAVKLQAVDDLDAQAVATDLEQFVINRLRSFYVERADVSVEMFDAVDNARDRSEMALSDFDQRMEAVKIFAGMAEAESLAAANKRISNILQQANTNLPTLVDTGLFVESAEIALYDALEKALADVAPLQSQREYAAVLKRLAALHKPVDRFFEEVMVMADDETVKRNRLALLSLLRDPFHSIADISRLSAARN